MTYTFDATIPTLETVDLHILDLLAYSQNYDCQRNIEYLASHHNLYLVGEEGRYSYVVNPGDYYLTRPSMDQDYVVEYTQEVRQTHIVYYIGDEGSYRLIHYSHREILKDVHVDGLGLPAYRLPDAYRTCALCNEENTQRHMERIGEVYVCRSCWNLKSYHTANEKRVGHHVYLPKFSVEFELDDEDNSIHHDDWNSIVLKFLENGYLRTRDGSVSEEMVSPIYYSDKEFLPALSAMSHAHSLGAVASTCGTHIHVELPLYPKKWLQEHYLIINRLGDYLTNSSFTDRIWGRVPSNYCKSHYLDDRYCWLNTETTYNTLEYRLPLFASARQYLMLVRFVRNFTVQYHDIYRKHLRSALPEEQCWDDNQVFLTLQAYYRKFESFAVKYV